MNLEGKHALITGGASGIGLAIAERFAAAGMRLSLADVDEAGLDAAAGRLGAATHPCDVSDPEAVAALAAAVEPVDLLCPNAGVAPVGPILELTAEGWDWLLAVNLRHVIDLTRLLVPGMVDRGEGHVAYVASGAGLMAVPTLGPYSVTKHGVVALAETLFTELAGTDVGVSVLCPGLVRTGIFDSERNRPERFGGADHEPSELQAAHQAMLAAGGTDPAEIAEEVHAAVVEGRFWILPHDEIRTIVGERARTIVEGTKPGGLDVG